MAGVAAAVGFLVLWPLYGELYRHGGDRPIEWTDLTSRTAEPVFTRAETRVFASEAELSRYLSRARSSIQIASTSPVRYLLSTVGPRSSTGYRLRVLRAVEQRGRILVRVREQTPQLEEKVAPRVTYPFVLLTLAKGHNPVRVELVGRP